jgi:hypothetical protein
MDVQKILVALDYSSDSLEALDWGLVSPGNMVRSPCCCM